VEFVPLPSTLHMISTASSQQKKEIAIPQGQEIDVKIRAKNAHSGQKIRNVTNTLSLTNARTPVTTQPASVRILAQRHAKIGPKMDYVRHNPGSMLIAQTPVNGIIVQHQLQQYQLQQLIALTDAQNYAKYGLAQTQMSPENVLDPVIQIAKALLTALTQTPAAAVMVNLDNVRLRGNALNGAMFLTG